MTCECGLLHEQTSAASCQECGTAGCPSCALEIDAKTYCRWCAALLAAPA
jgi:hypothetical protein